MRPLPPAGQATLSSDFIDGPARWTRAGQPCEAAPAAVVRRFLDGLANVRPAWEGRPDWSGTPAPTMATLQDLRTWSLLPVRALYVLLEAHPGMPDAVLREVRRAMTEWRMNPTAMAAALWVSAGNYQGRPRTDYVVPPTARMPAFAQPLADGPGQVCLDPSAPNAPEPSSASANVLGIALFVALGLGVLYVGNRLSYG